MVIDASSFTVASTTRFARSFPTRTIRVGLPSWVVITACREKTMRPTGWLNLAKTIPALSAVMSKPTVDSATMRKLLASVSGNIPP